MLRISSYFRVALITLLVSLLFSASLAQDGKLLRGVGGNPVVESGGGGSSLLTNLISFWKLAGTADAASTNTLTNNGTVTFTTGKIGNGASFNGTTQWLSIADNSALSTGDISFSIFGWAKANDFTDTQILVSKWGGPGGSSDNEYRIYLDGQLLKFDIQNADGPVIDLDALTNDIQTGEWFYFIATYNSVTDVATLQVNDDPESLTTVGSVPAPPNGASDFCIGAQMDGDNSFNGMMDALGFWKPKVFTSLEITAGHNSGAGIEHPF